MLSEVNIDISGIEAKNKALIPKIELATGAIMRKGAQDIQSFARATAPWTDQTGNARNGLMGSYDKEGTKHTITLAHSVPYGIWLEVRWAGRYAIIAPSIETEAPRIMHMFTKLIEKLGGSL